MECRQLFRELIMSYRTSTTRLTRSAVVLAAVCGSLMGAAQTQAQTLAPMVTSKVAFVAKAASTSATSSRIGQLVDRDAGRPARVVT